MHKLANNFYIKMLIRALKEYDKYVLCKDRIIKELIPYIYDKNSFAFPHMNFDELGFFNHKTNKMILMYMDLIKEHYINDIIKLILMYDPSLPTTTKFDTMEIWSYISNCRLSSYLCEKWKIDKNLITNKYKFKIFYKEISE